MDGNEDNNGISFAFFKGLSPFHSQLISIQGNAQPGGALVYTFDVSNQFLFGE